MSKKITVAEHIRNRKRGGNAKKKDLEEQRFEMQKELEGQRYFVERQKKFDLSQLDGNKKEAKGLRDQKKDDCYFYYYSSCNEGDLCKFRHEPAALHNEKMCIHWLKGNCTKLHCTFRHLKINKNRSKIACYHEEQPSGCLKDNCPFYHKFRENINNDEANVKENKKMENLSPSKLAKILSEFPDFDTPLTTLFERFEYKPEQVKKVVSDNCDVFEMDGRTVSLRPKINVCQSYLEDDGCNLVSSSSMCTDLHICLQYLEGKCLNDDCIFGHSWSTKHNTLVVNSFKLNLLTPNLMFRLFTEYIFISVSKRELKICKDYNEGNCNASHCTHLHLCLRNLAKLCSSKNNCSLNHEVSDKEMISILKFHDIPVNETPRDIFFNILSSPHVKRSIKQLIMDESTQKTADSYKVNPIIKTIWAHDYNGEVVKAEICYNSVEKYCPGEDGGCPRLHCEFYYYWQVRTLNKTDSFWVNLTKDLVIALEKAYCNPVIDRTPLPQLNPASIQASHKGLIAILKGKSMWEADFNSMTLNSKEQLSLNGLQLRRLCSEHTSNPTPAPCVFAWYFLDINKVWIEYGKVDSAKKETLISNVASADIEKAYKQNPQSILTLNNQSYHYNLDFSNMLQTNLQTNVTRKVKRRPLPHIKEDSSTLDSKMALPDYWEAMQPNNRFQVFKLSSTSDEYTKVVTCVQQGGGITNITKIERIQNLYFWRAFQNKVEEMTQIYKTESGVNIKQLFHGTNPSTVTKIYAENFDWKMHGTNSGQSFGRGAYFSSSTRVSMGYATPDLEGCKFMFVAMVAIGSIAVGASSMTRPPMNPLTNLPFDSTVDNTANPAIIVKYDKQEYFPQYLITYS